MRVLVYEHTCGAGRASSPESLCVEGRAMLDAVLDDFRRVPGVEPVTLLDIPPDEEHAALAELARSCDLTLLVAPECDGILRQRCLWVEDAGGRLLGPSSSAVGLTGDKLVLAHHLRDRGVPTPPCFRSPGEASYPAVCKPRDGAGSQATFLVRSPEEAAARMTEWPGEMLLQPFVPGLAASVAFLIGPRDPIPLLPAAQHLSDDGHFRYLGGCLPLPDGLATRAAELGRRAVESVPGLRGYVGVDLVLGEDGDAVIEINPRLTTSYVGLRALAETNLAAAMLGVVSGEAVSLRWRAGEARW
jgi:predicted ATP-grasp superfamily ATP-dependent carboligase